MNSVKKVMTSFNKMDKWVKYVLIVCVVLIIFSMLWPYSNFMGVKLNSYNQPFFEGFSKDDNKPTMVFFYAPWCGYCKKTKPDWEKFEKKHKNNDINIISINCTLDENKEIAKLHGVTGYPTIKYCPNGLSSTAGVIEFDDERTDTGFFSFLSKHYNK